MASRGDRRHLYAGGRGGEPQPLVVGREQCRIPTWSRDGRFVYCVMMRAGEREIWRAPVDGGQAARFGNLQGRAPRESPDGKSPYYFRAGEVWRVALQGGAPTGGPVKVLDGLEPDADWGNWDVSGDGIYSIQRGKQGVAAIEYLDFATRAVRTIYVMPKLPVYAGHGLSLSPDGKSLLFSQVDRDEYQIFAQSATEEWG